MCVHASPLPRASRSRHVFVCDICLARFDQEGSLTRCQVALHFSDEPLFHVVHWWGATSFSFPPLLASSRTRRARVCYSVRGSRSSLRRASTVHFGFVDKLSLWSCVTKTEIKNNTTNKLLLKQLCFHSCLCSLIGLLYNGFKFVSCVTFPFQG